MSTPPAATPAAEPPVTDASPRSARGILLSTVAAGVVASAVNIVIGVAARAAGADSTVSGMTVSAEIALSVIGVLAGAAGWALVRRFAARPGLVLAVLVPIVFLLSLVPVVGFGIASGTSAIWTAMIGLSIMHLLTIAIALPVYRRFLPL